MFQSTRPCGARPDPICRRVQTTSFQSTRPCGARRRRMRRSSWRRCFNPRAPAGRDVKIEKPANKTWVSIHAPLRGATSKYRYRNVADYVSIHAPLRGATPNCPITVDKAQFQSTRPCGARPPAFATTDGPGGFQSTRPCGARLIRFKLSIVFLQFQSTRPCGARRSYCPNCNNDRKFQSTRPCGARPDYQYQHQVPERVSIHAPLRGATGARYAPQGNNPCFNPRAPAGRDARALRSIHFCIWFQSTRPCGARLDVPLATTVLKLVSIHAPLRGATSRGSTGCISYCSFNPRAPAGRDLHVAVRAIMRTCFNPRAPAGRDLN